MSAEKATEMTDLDYTVAERMALFQQNIDKSKRTFIQNKAQEDLLSVLGDCRKDLDKAEARMLAQIGRNTSSLFSFFSSSKKVVPAEASDALIAEFETARKILFDINNAIVNDVNETNLVKRASRQYERFDSDMEKLRDGIRLKKYWNDPNESRLDSDEIKERKELGMITKPKIFNILETIDEVLKIFPSRMDNFLKTTQERVNDIIEKHIEATYKEFSKSPLGEFLVILVELKNKTARMESDGKPQAYIDKQLRKLTQAVETAKDYLGDVDLAKANQIEKHDFNVLNKKHQYNPISQLDALAVALPDEKFKDFIQQISKDINLYDKSAEKQSAASHYRRQTQ
jgi:hypothetical protein